MSLRNEFRILIENPLGKQPFGRRRKRLEDNTEVELRGIGC
jgi:hypothetical protein